MNDVGFDIQSRLFPALDHERADVCGPEPGYAGPTMMRLKIIGDTSGKVVRLADIYRVIAREAVSSNENINSGQGFELAADIIYVKFVPGSRSPGNN